MKFSSKGGFSGAYAKFDKLRELPTQANLAASRAAELMQQEAVENLATQGRSRPPALSPATKKIQRLRGKPTGKGVRQHIQTKEQVVNGRFVATCGIPNGRPSMIAKVQNFGATIKVTPKMRGFLAAHGIYLKSTTGVIRIPARKFWTLADRTAKQQYRADLKQLLP